MATLSEGAKMLPGIAMAGLYASLKEQAAVAFDAAEKRILEVHAKLVKQTVTALLYVAGFSLLFVALILFLTDIVRLPRSAVFLIGGLILITLGYLQGKKGG